MRAGDANILIVASSVLILGLSAVEARGISSYVGHSGLRVGGYRPNWEVRGDQLRSTVSVLIVEL